MAQADGFERFDYEIACLALRTCQPEVLNRRHHDVINFVEGVVDLEGVLHDRLDFAAELPLFRSVQRSDVMSVEVDGTFGRRDDA